jgi:hypothetical protein
LTPPAVRPGRFALSKWYLDLVTPDGRALVAYWGEIAWRRAKLRLESVLDGPPARPAAARARVTREAGPREGQDGGIAWSARGLGLEAHWQPLAAPISRRLFSSPRGALDWECRAPLARVTATLGRGTELSGLGYAERLTLTLAPWELPIEQLRWGRFCASARSLVWIQWSGPSPLTLVFADGVEISGAVVSDDGVEMTSEARLCLEGRRELRAGRPVAGLVARLPGLRAAVPRRLHGIEESKWISRGALSGAGVPTVEGWAIHEVVRFGGEKR